MPALYFVKSLNNSWLKKQNACPVLFNSPRIYSIFATEYITNNIKNNYTYEKTIIIFPDGN